jgi:DNA-binding transcriptional ArsR family regulator
MPEHTTVAAEYASAVAHPIRIRLVAALADGPRILESLTSELDASDEEIRGHARALKDLAVLQVTDHEEGTQTYELLREPIFWDTAWGSLPLATKRSAAAAGVTQMAAAATAAVDRGGFDRHDMHLTRTTLRVDEARWRELATLLGGTLHSLGDLAEAPEPDGTSGPTFQATAVMMLFTGEQAEANEQPPSTRWDEEAALSRTWELCEQLERLTPRAVPDWDSIVAISEELRSIAQAMRASGKPPAHTDDD